ncbi:hypothetical protein HKX48_007732, partial [Thoreauomyces humboldtii]
MWLTAAGLYRVLGDFSQADGAVSEAEKLVSAMAQMDSMLRRLPSRLYQTGSMSRTLQEQGKFRRVLASGKGFLRHHRRGGGEDRMVAGEPIADIPKWGIVGANVKRAIADVAFEGALIRQAQYDKLTTPPPVSKYDAHLSPAEKLDAERSHRAWEKTVKRGLDPCNSVTRRTSEESMSSVESNATMQTLATVKTSRTSLSVATPPSMINGSTPPLPPSA